jgi:hypothetical protein
MLKGIDLLGYAVNEMGGDKLMTLYKIADEMLGLDDITRRAISLINPYNQYSFLEEIILNAENSDDKLVELLESHKIAIPRRFGWKHIRIDKRTDKETTVDKIEWFDNRHQCYCDMHKNAMYEIQNCIDCHDLETIIRTTNDTLISISCGVIESRFMLYEM